MDKFEAWLESKIALWAEGLDKYEPKSDKWWTVVDVLHELRAVALHYDLAKRGKHT